MRRHLPPLLLLLFAVATISTVFADNLNPLERAAQLARASGAYEFSADLTQTFHPRPHPAMIGHSDETVQWQLDGAISEADRQGILEISFAGTQDSLPPVKIIQDGEQTFLQSTTGIQPFEDENALSSIAPTTDFLTYLAASDNVEMIGSRTIAGELFTQYSFTINGTELGNILIADQQAQQADTMPGGMRLSAPETYQRMRGTGEVWLDSAGYPRRQSLNLEMPQVDTYYDGQVEMSVDFRNFGAAGDLPHVVPAGDGWQTSTTWQPSATILQEVSRFQQASQATQTAIVEGVPSTLLIFAAILVVVVFVRLYLIRPKRIHAFLAYSLIFLMVGTPFLQPLPYMRYFERQAEAAENAGQRSNPIFDALGLQTAQPPETDPQADAPPDAPVRATTIHDTRNALNACGDGDPTLDYDEDGLSNFAETCIGTSIYRLDSDYDTITDTLEISGFEYAGQMWTTNPLEPDSNKDGLRDLQELPAPWGNAPNFDQDQDGQPNVWDDDNDGDGVVDSIDLSPFVVQPHHNTLSLNLSGDRGDEYVYIEVQIQPQNSDHLRYTTTPLDWPEDVLGQIQDFDDSPADITLLPFLEVQSSAAPNAELTEKYGLIVSQDDDKFRVSLPLFTQGDGAVSNFYGKIAYAPDDFATLEWEYARLTWTVLIDNDFCATNGCSGEQKPAHTYYEPYRLTGLRVTRSGDVSATVFGTPDTPTEDKTLFEFMFGMNAIFLDALEVENQPVGRTMLEEIMVRFQNPQAPFETTWGIDDPLTTLPELARFDHQDAMLGGAGEIVTNFLDTNYPASAYADLCQDGDASQFRCATLVSATETEIGSAELATMQITPEERTFPVPEGIGTTTQQGIGIHVNLSEISVNTLRDVELTLYENVNGAWDVTNPARMMEIIMHRYDDTDWQRMAEEMQSDYPSMNASFTRIGAFMGYMTFNVGFSRMMTQGNYVLVNQVSADAALAQSNVISGNDYSDAPSQMLETAQVAAALEFVDSLGSLAIEATENTLDILVSSVSEVLAALEAYEMISAYRARNFSVNSAADNWKGNFVADKMKNGMAFALGVIGFIVGLLVFVLSALVAIASAGLGLAQTVCAGLELNDTEGDECNEDALHWVTTTSLSLAVVSATLSLISAIFDIVNAVLHLVNATTKLAAAISAATVVFAIIGVVIAIIAFVANLVIIWVMFGLLAANSKSRMTIDQEIGRAIVASIIALVLLILIIVAIILLAIFPIGTIIGATILVLLAIFGIIDGLLALITFLATGEVFSITEWVTGNLANALVNTTLLTEPGNIGFTEPRTLFSGGDFMRARGPAVTGAFTFSDRFEGEIQATDESYSAEDFFSGDTFDRDIYPDSGVSDDLHDSGALGFYEGESSAGAATAELQNRLLDGTMIPARDDSDASDDSDCEIVTPYELILCKNEVGVRYHFIGAQRNVRLPLNTFIDFDLRYELCVGSGLTLGFCPQKKIKTEDVNLPGALDDDDAEAFRSELYLDVLPERLTGFWSWSGINNPDPDGDGLLAAEEAAVGTSPTNWDTDGDGLSDKFEVDSRNELGTNPLKADSDGDTLNDRFELTIGTNIASADSDGDSLTDAEEVYHQDANGNWVGGWEINIPTYGTVHVYSDPLSADADNDNLSDSQERKNGTSPNAVNDAPALLVLAEPPAYQAAPDGRQAVFVEPGDEVSLTVLLASVGAFPVETALSLCLPPELINIQGGSMVGDREPFKRDATCPNGGTGYLWHFNNTFDIQDFTLQLGEGAGTQFTTQVDPTLTSSQTSVISYSLPYQDKVIDGTIDIFVDVDDPDVAIFAPADGAFLRGSSFVVGGTASDPTSWVETVEVDLDDGNGFTETVDVGLWVQTWTLPDDGVYTVRARATDHFGRTSPIDSHTVTVDNTPPTVQTDLDDDALINNVGTTVLLTGDATDNLSGIARVQLNIDETYWREATISDNGTSPTWSYSWLLGSGAQGSHTIDIRTYDRAGNLSEIVHRDVVVDVVPPTSDLTSRLNNETIPTIDSNSVIFGYANDRGNLPLPPRPTELIGTLDSLDDATVWLSADSVHDDDDGVTLQWLGDINGDGRGDMAIGLPAADNGNGRIHIVYGQTGDFELPNSAEMLSDGESVFVGTAGAGLGAQIAAVGDVNGDSLADMLIGDPANNRAILVYGKLRPYGTNDLSSSSEALQHIFVAPAGYGLGRWVAAPGDVNGDGQSDLLIGGEAQAVLILANEVVWRDDDLDALLHAAAFFDIGGDARITGLGDIDGDQLDDWAVSDPADALGGGVGLYVQSIAEIPDTVAFGSNVVIDPAANNKQFIGSVGFGTDHVVALGDVNGDQLDDFILSSGNAPRLVYGAAGALNVGVEFAGYTPAPSGFLAAPGDVNADGFNDILLGTADNSAFLIHGGDSLPANPPVAATINDVADAASTPFAAGADLNCDFSSDLLLLPIELTASRNVINDIDFSDTSHYAVESLPLAPLVAPNRSAILATLHVDDDLLCGGNTPCYDSVTDALAAAGANDVLLLYPGLYTPFTISTDDVVVQGVNADAVFVDGQGGTAVTIADATGVQVSQMTIRNATNGVRLSNAGVGGEITPTLTTQLDHLLVYDTEHAISTDRTSVLAVADSTFAGNSAEIIHITGDPDPLYSPQFTIKSDTPFTIGVESDLISADDGSLIYALPTKGSSTLGIYDVANDSWSQNSNTPETLDAAIHFADGDALGVLRGNYLGTGVSNQPTPIAFNLAAHWKFDDGSGSTAADSSGNGNTATLHHSLSNTVNWREESAPNDLDNPYSISLSSFFEDYLDAPSIALNQRDFTVAFWAKRGSPSTDDYIVTQGTDSDNNGLHIGFRSDNTFTCAFWGNDLNTSMAYTDTDWHHWACSVRYINAGTFSQTRRTIYRDGIVVAEDSVFTPYIGSGPIFIGKRFDDSGYFGGHLDDMRIYQRELSQVEIQNLFSARINAIAKDDATGEIYVGGYFSEIDGVAANNIAVWNGMEWRALGGGTNGEVYALAVSGSSLYVGGDFNRVNGTNVVANHVAQWNGTQWLALSSGSADPDIESGFNEPVRALAADGNGGVYAGGDFDEPSGVPNDRPSNIPSHCIPGPYEVALFDAEDYNINDRTDWCRVFEIGDYDNNDERHFPDEDDGSILVGINVKAVLYDDQNFEGARVTLSTDMEETDEIAFDSNDFLGNDVGSLRVQLDNYVGTRSNSLCQPNDYEIALFESEDYTGDCWILDIGEHRNADDDQPWNDVANSIIVGDLVYVEAYLQQDFNSHMIVIADNREDLSDLTFDNGDDVENDIESLEVILKETRHRIAHWNGSSWTPLDGGVADRSEASVQALARVGNNLHVGGHFAQPGAGAVLGANFATWDMVNTTWTAVDSSDKVDINGPVYDIATMGSDILIGGSFSELETTTYAINASNVAVLRNDGWQALGSGLNAQVNAVAIDADGDLLAGGHFTNIDYLGRWNGSGWERFRTGTDNRVNVLLADVRDVYAGGVFEEAGGVAVQNLARWAQPYRYDNGWSAWEIGHDPVMQQFGRNTVAAEHSGNGNLFIVYVADGQYQLLRYRPNLDDWDQRAALTPANGTAQLDTNSRLAYASGALYLLIGDAQSNDQAFYRYDLSTLQWSTLSAPPFTAVSPSMKWDDGDYLYVTANGSSQPLLRRYHLGDEVWENLDSVATGMPAVSSGSGLVRADDAFYLTIGGSSRQLWRLDVPTIRPNKLTITDTTFVVPGSTANATWLGFEQANSLKDDYNIINSNVELVGGAGTTWTPSDGATTLTHAQADYLDPANNGYRTGAASTLTSGYYSYAPPATVSATGCLGCFTSIQAAVDSGSQTIYLEGGVYQEPFYLVSGVSLFGSGAAVTVIEPPVSPRAGELPLVTMEGIRGVTLANVTLHGAGMHDGIYVEDGAANIRITRNIVRETVEAIQIDGAETTVEIVNNTLVNNENGVVANGNAPIDVRNTLFVHHTGTALGYQSGATALHRYNGFFGNSADLTIDNTPINEPGVGEVFADPLFTNILSDDYTLLAFSPMIDAGNPSDPSPPGAGGRTDIGYSEFGAAGFYVDDDYCQTCLNDGLTFSVDAFNVISDALAAANRRTMTLGIPANGAHTVGVAAGTYNEKLYMPSYINLVCDGADNVTIDGTGIDTQHSTIWMQRVRNVAVRHCHVTGSLPANNASAGIRIGIDSSNVILLGNLVESNESGIIFARGGSGVALFNTVADNTRYGIRTGLTTGDQSWAEISNNIVANNGESGISSAPVATLYSNYNIVFGNPTNFDGVTQGVDDLIADPQFVRDVFGNPYHLATTSPAVDSASPAFGNVPAGGGAVADRGAFELRALPLTLLFGKEGVSCEAGNSGVASAEISFVPVSSRSEPLTATVPTSWQATNLTSVGATASYWSANVGGLSDGLYRLFTRATDANGNQEDDLNAWFEGHVRVESVPRRAASQVLVERVGSAESQADPVLTVTNPTQGGVYSDTVLFNGTVSDDDGVAAVEVSFDNGTTWSAATLNADQWSWTWEVRGYNPAVNYPTQVRATDTAGEQTVVTRTVTIDTSAPQGITPIVSNIREGSHLDSYQTLTLDWEPVRDIGGATVYISVDQDPNGAATEIVTANSYSAPLDANGAWYAHLAAVDGAGNRTEYELGAWHVGTFTESAVACGVRDQSITLDGYLNVLRGEWNRAEILDDDMRDGNAPALYTTWDGDAFYLGVINWWGTSGTFWAYLDDAAGGASVGVGGEQLGISAEHAVQINDAASGLLWTYSGGSWQSSPLQFSHNSNGGTEILLPWAIDSVSTARLLAFIADNNDDTIAVFPTTNSLDGAWTDAYEWSGVCDIAEPNDGQPTAPSVALQLDSVQPTLTGLGADAPLVYSVTVQNRELSALTDVTVLVSPTVGLAYQSINGATCQDCAGTVWTINVGDLAGLGETTFTLNGQLASDLTAIDTVRTVAEGVGSNLESAELRHIVDATAPTVTIATGEKIINVGNQQFIGIASDDYAGVERVELREQGGTWQPADGTTSWTGTLNVAGSQFVLEAQAFDAAGNVSATEVATFTVDTIAPIITDSLQTVITSTGSFITGTVSDPFPPNGRVRTVEVQADSAQDMWVVTALTNDVWGFWTGDFVDNDTFTYRMRATDLAGNVSVNDWQTITIDLVAPTISVTTHISAVAKADYVARAGEPVLSGTVTDGAGVQSVSIRIQRPDGSTEPILATTFDGTSWSFTPTFAANDPIGRYNLFVEATDTNGNQQIAGAYKLDVDADQLAVRVVQAQVSPLTTALVWLFVAQLIVLTGVALRLRRRED